MYISFCRFTIVKSKFIVSAFRFMNSCNCLYLFLYILIVKMLDFLIQQLKNLNLSFGIQSLREIRNFLSILHLLNRNRCLIQVSIVFTVKTCI